MIGARVLALALLVLCAVRCGGVAERSTSNAVTIDDSAPVGCAAPAPTATLDTGVCSIAHEPATQQCDPQHVAVYRCTTPESQPAPECMPSLDCDPSVWCCP